MAEQNAIPLMENEHVKELLAIMEANNVPDRKDLLAVLNQVSAMEKQLNAAVTELAAMRRELNEAREQAHPVKIALQSAVSTMEKNVAVLRERLDKVKQNIIDGCKNAVAAFKEKGIVALDNISKCGPCWKLCVTIWAKASGLTKRQSQIFNRSILRPGWIAPQG